MGSSSSFPSLRRFFGAWRMNRTVTSEELDPRFPDHAFPIDHRLSGLEETLIMSIMKIMYVDVIAGYITRFLTMAECQGGETTITLLHFNDCYNIESQKTEPVGGAARFKTVLKSFDFLEPLVLFSGDIVSPSSMSTFTKGEQMITVLNSFKTACAVYGNHDFDFGIDNLINFKNKCQFPWLMSNVLDKETDTLLAEGLEYVVLEHKSKRIGVIGLVEVEWIATLGTIEAEDVEFRDFVDVGNRLARLLKGPDFNCDYVIALTHMRFPNDCRLAENVEEIDLILGGHDHVYDVRTINGKRVVKSGTDFRQLSKIDLTFRADKSVTLEIEEINVTSDYHEDPELLGQLEGFYDVMEGQMDAVVGYFSADVDCRFKSTRTKETNIGSFVTDILRASTHADLAMLNSGTFRSDRVHEAGIFTMRDIISIFPSLDPILVYEVTGEQIKAALENGVSQYPKLEGRFPQVSGVSFAFNPGAPPGQRVKVEHVKIGEEQLDLNKVYRMASKKFIWSGKDGYESLKNSPVLVDPDELPPLRTLLQGYLAAMQSSFEAEKQHRSHHRPSLVPSCSFEAASVESSPNSEVVKFHPVTDGRIIALTKEWYSENSGLLHQSPTCPNVTPEDFV